MDLFDDLPDPGNLGERRNQNEPDETLDNNGSEIFSGLPPPSSDSEPKTFKRKMTDQNENSETKKSAKASFELQGFVAERKGEREEMQDCHVVLDDFKRASPQLQSSKHRISIYAVFDGHGGARASKYAAANLHVNLGSALSKVDDSQIEKEMKRVMLEAFKKTDEAFLKQAKSAKPSWKDGTTAIVVMAVNDSLYIANIGDSKAILCRHNKDAKKHTAIPLSKDHSPTEYMERMRIQKAGGYVREGRVMGILEVSRSIGDGQYKALGVTCVPDVKRCQLTEDDRFVLLACDGLWKVFTSEEVLQIVLGSSKIKSEVDSTDEGWNNICYETACNRLVGEAIRRQSGDNVTVLIAAIKQSVD